MILGVEALVEHLHLEVNEALETRTGLDYVRPSDAWVRAEIEQMDAQDARLLAVKDANAHSVEISDRSRNKLLSDEVLYLLH